MSLLDIANRGIRTVLKGRGVESTFRYVADESLHYYRLKGTGVGPPLLLIHGLGSSANAFSRTFLPLARHFSEIYAIDLPGNGFSPLPRSGPMSVYQQVDVLLRFHQEVIGRPVFLVGNSLGGAMSLFAAHRAPEAFAGLALVSPAGAPMAPDRIAALKVSFEVSTNGDARAMTRRLFHRAPLGLLLFAGQLRTLYGSPSVQSILKEVDVKDAVTADMLGGLAMPTLLIWGQSEKLLPYESIDYFRAHLPAHAEVQEVKGFGHMPQMEHPREFVDRLIGFARTRGLVS